MFTPSDGKNRIAASSNPFFPMNRRRAVITLLFLTLIPVYWIAYRAPAVGIFHDDGIYLVTAKALAEGKGYRIISLPSEMNQTKYPILFPALLAIIWKVFPSFPENASLLKLIPLLGTFFWVWFVHKFIMEKTNSFNISVGIVLITLASPGVVVFSSLILSETVFACFCAGALLYLDRLTSTPVENENSLLLFSAIFSAAAFLTRTAGLPLLISGVIILIFRRRYRSSMKYFLLCSVIIFPWIWWLAINHASTPVANDYYSFSNYQHWNTLVNYSLTSTGVVFATNFLDLMFAPIYLLGLAYGWSGAFIFTLALAILLMSFALLGFLWDLREGIKSIHLFFIFYCGMLLVWVWPPFRFVVPIFPFWLFFAYKGLMSLGVHISLRGWGAKIANAGFVFLLCFSLWNALYLFSEKALRLQKVSIMFEMKAGGEELDWKKMNSLSLWIRDNTPDDSILLGNLDPAIYLYTGRKAVRGFVADPYLLWYSGKPEESLGSESDLLDVLIKNKVNYIIRTRDDTFKEVPIFNHMLDRILLKDEKAFRLVKEGSHPGYRIYWVNQKVLQQNY
jgi:hypothetical protein